MNKTNKVRRSGRTISAETEAALNEYLAHSEKAIAVLQSIIDGSDANPAARARLRRIIEASWTHAIN